MSELEQQPKAVIFSGFPYDEGTRINGGRIGGSVASSIFRKTLSQHQIYPSQQIPVYDAGDIEHDLDLPKAHERLELKHKEILSRHPRHLLVSIGGSNDQSYPNVAALLGNAPNKVGVINIDAHFDVRPLKEGKAHSGSPFRLML
jgi:formiminoglutamase